MERWSVCRAASLPDAGKMSTESLMHQSPSVTHLGRCLPDGASAVGRNYIPHARIT
jgi:hypothetical protein